MQDWVTWLGTAAALAAVGALPLVLLIRRSSRRSQLAGLDAGPETSAESETRPPATGTPAPKALQTGTRRRILVVDDDPALRLLLRTTLAVDEFELEEASGAVGAGALARFRRPSVVILDVGLPDGDGLTLCRQLKRIGGDEPPAVILLTGADASETEAAEAGADALLRKPFSPLELLGVLDGLGKGRTGPMHEPPKDDAGQLLLYARDLNRLLEVERTQRRLLQQAYRQTTSALADALEAKDRRTGIHALRVQSYAIELTEALDPTLLDDQSLEHGFLLHDIGKIAIPDPILNKPGPLTEGELQTVRRHPLIGAEILQDVALLQGEGIHVVRSHHERWDGAGYPDGLAGDAIPLGARIFALADTLDAMTTDRPYRRARSWDEAIEEIMAQNGRQFDPRVVRAFARRETTLRRLYREFASMAA